MDVVGIFKLYDNSNGDTHTYCMVLELKTASKKVTELETKIQRMEEEQTEQNHGELLFTTILYSKGGRVVQLEEAWAVNHAVAD